MIRFGWMLLTALGFMVAGALLAHGEFKFGLGFMVGAWIWMAFPKVTLWLLEGAGKLFSKRGKAPATGGQHV